MPLPPDDIRAKLAQLRNEFAMRAALQSEYDKEMSGKYIHEMIPFADWLAQRNAPTGKAGGGLMKFLKASAVKDRVYHGTPNSFSQFEESPTYVSFDPSFASDYGVSKAEGLEYSNDDTAQGPSVMPLHVQVKNPFDYENPDHVKNLFSLLKKSGVKWLRSSRPIKEGSFEVIEDPDVLEAIKKLGHDGFYVNEGYDSKVKNLGVFDPRKIKSAIGNRGTYDPNDPDITKASGGSVPSLDVMRLAIGGQGPRNWLKGSVEKVINPLKVGPQDPNADFHYVRDETSPDGWRTVPNPPDPINLWIERNLANYIRKQMATHDDPIRKLAEQGIVHMPPEQMRQGTSLAEPVRKRLDAPRLGQSEAAQAWEDAADVSMHPIKIKDIPTMSHRPNVSMEPWMEKADPNTEMFYPTDYMNARFLGFDHIVDILKQDLAEGRIRPEQLSKVSIEQAVRRTHQYDQERKKAMAQTALKATEGMPVHKDYGDGFKWIELTKPAIDPNEPMPEKYEARLPHPNSWGLFDKTTGKYVATGLKSAEHARQHALDIAGEKKLADALKYEGDTMGHCVGGYCPDVSSGEARIFSLRDAKNEPHVTVEVKPARYEELPESKKLEHKTEAMRQLGYTNSRLAYDMKAREEVASQARALAGKDHQRIVQIKGKQNAKPKQDYIPYVQDFVKSGNWSDVGDLHNTELKHISRVPEREQFEKAGMQLPQYLSDKDHDELINEYNRRTKPSFDQDFFDKAYGKAEGGEVESSPAAAPKNQGVPMNPTIAQMKMALAKGNPLNVQNIGADEAPSMSPKTYLPPDTQTGKFVPPGGAATPSGLAVGGIDMNSMQPGNQLMPSGLQAMQPPPQQPQQGPQQAPQGQQGQAPQAGGNILQMTPQGRAMAAIGPQQAPGMAGGGQPKKPLHYPPSPALSKAQIEAHAERMARQVSGLENPNEKTLKQLAREQDLPVGIRKAAKKQDVPVIDWAEKKGSYSVGVPGDPSRGGLVPASRSSKRMGMAYPKAGEYLESVGGERLESPVPLYGGKDYGAYGHPEGWASDLGASAGMFNIVKRLAEEDPTKQIYGHYHKMSPESLYHAVHMMDAVLSHHRPHEQSPEMISNLNRLMRDVAITTNKDDRAYPEFPGFENPSDVMFHGSLNSGMRKKIIKMLGTEKYFPGGKQKLEDLIYAVSHPELRNIETGAGGSSILQFDPSRELRQQVSKHPTYGHDIPSKLVGRNRYITPAEIIAPRSMHNAAQEIKAMGKKVVPFNQAKMNIIREPIDEQFINQMGEYEHAMKKRLGYKKGGKVSQDTMRLELTKQKKGK